MENINQILQCLDGFRRLSVEIDTARRAILGAQLRAQCNAKGVFHTAVEAVVNGNRTAWNSNIRCIDLNDIDFLRVRYQSHPLDKTQEQPIEIVKIG